MGNPLSISTILPFILVLFSCRWSAVSAQSYNGDNNRNITNEDIGIFDDQLEVEISLQPFRLLVKPTDIILGDAQAKQVIRDVEDLMNQHLQSLPKQAVGNFEYLTLNGLESISFDSGSNNRKRRSLTNTGAKASVERRVEAREPATTLEIDGIKVGFINNPPSKANIRDWLQTVVNEHEFAADSSNGLTSAAIVKSNTQPSLSSVPIYSITLVWASEYIEGYTNAPSPSTPTRSPTPVEAKRSKAANAGLPISLSAAGCVLIFLSLFLVKRRRDARPKEGLLSSGDSLDRNEYNGLDYIYDMGSKIGGFPIFKAEASDLMSPTSNPEQIEVAVPAGKAQSDVSSLDTSEHNVAAAALANALKSFSLSRRDVSDVSSLGASDHNVVAAVPMATALKQFPLTNLTRVNGNLYNETNEGFDRLEDAWVSDSESRTRNVPRMLGRSEESVSLRYSDTSSISLETEHFYPDKTWDPNDNDFTNDVEEIHEVFTPPPTNVQSMSKFQKTKDQYDLDAVEYDDRSTIGDLLPSVV